MMKIIAAFNSRHGSSLFAMPSKLTRINDQKLMPCLNFAFVAVITTSPAVFPNVTIVQSHFVFPSRLFRGQRAVDLGAVLKKKIRPAFEGLGLGRVGWHTFRHTVGTLLAEMGEHQLTLRDYLRHSNLCVTNKYLQGASSTKRKAQEKLVEAILPVHLRVTTIAEAVAP